MTACRRHSGYLRLNGHRRGIELEYRPWDYIEFRLVGRRTRLLTWRSVRKVES